MKTGNKTDQNIEVIWANATDVFLSSTPVGIGFTLIPDRAVNVFGFETKTVILSAREGNAVRNRVHASRKFPSESLRQELEGASKNVYIFEVNIYVYLYIIVGTRRRKAAGGIRAAATAAAMYVGYQMFFMVCSSTESRSRRSDGRSRHGCSSSSDRLPRGLRTVEEAKSTVRRFKHGRARRRNRKQMD